MNKLSYARSMQDLIREFSKMPGIGSRTAERLAFYILRLRREEAEGLAKSIRKVNADVKFCRLCNNLSDAELCHICRDTARDKGTVCVVEEPNDVAAVEKTGKFNGVYHVLLGRLSPLDGIGPEALRIEGLEKRVQSGKIKELLIATNSDTEGETTALYITKRFKPYGLRITRLAYGIPVGGNLKYADKATLMKAIEGRLELS